MVDLVIVTVSRVTKSGSTSCVSWLQDDGVLI